MSRGTREVTVVSSRLRVTNVKISFKVEKNIIFSETLNHPLITYYNKNNFIIYFYEWVCTVLGSKLQHVNITGIKNLKDIETCLEHFYLVSNVRKEDITSLKTDNISITCSTKPGLRERIISIQSCDSFNLTVPPRFCGLILRFEKCTIIYFNTGKANLVGVQSLESAELALQHFERVLEVSGGKQDEM